MRDWGGLFAVLLLVMACSAPLLAEQPEAQTVDNTRKKLVANNLRGDLLEVHFLDIGQGDGMFVRTPGGKNYLIDCGPRSAYKKIVPYLKYLKVKELDGVLLTHSHMDHMGSLYKLSNDIPIKMVYSSGYFHTSKHNEKTLARLEEKKIKMSELKRGDRLELDEDVVLTVVHPPRNWKPYDSELNDYSVVTRLSYGDIDFLLTGDAERKAEKAMMKGNVVLRSEFLKVGHHGSNTASSKKFLEAVSPLFAIISCGVDNKFKHPHEETLNGLKARDATILRTDESGTIGIYTNGERVMIKIKGKNWQPEVSD